MNKKLLNFLSIIIVSLLFISCTPMAPVKETPISINAKTFDKEDVFILFALRAEKIKDYKTAAELYTTLYEKSQKKEYLYKSLTNSITAKNNQKVIDTVDNITKTSLDDFKLIRFKIIALLQMQKIDDATVLATALVEKSEATPDYLLLSDIYIKQKKYNIALKYLESAYVKEYNERILDKMAIIQYVNLGRKKDAIAQLETHSRIKGCSKLICARLISFYSNENNIDGILSTYLRMYDEFKKPEIANKIVQIFGYQKKYPQMIAFLEKSKTDDETLLQLYVMKKNYKKAFALADKLYESSGDISFLGQSAIYEYESNDKKDDKKVLDNVINKLEKVVKEASTPMYENYLGYVLIDHEIDINKGMEYIKNVLKVQPKSAFYLDSLAWGYYKLGQCSKAKEIIDKVVKLEGGDDPEVIEHVKEIYSCVKNKKVRK